jgi:hypothetical protein
VQRGAAKIGGSGFSAAATAAVGAAVLAAVVGWWLWEGDRAALRPPPPAPEPPLTGAGPDADSASGAPGSSDALDPALGSGGTAVVVEPAPAATVAEPAPALTGSAPAPARTGSRTSGRSPALRSASANATSRGDEEPSPHASTRNEIELIGRARAALPRDPAAALALLDEHRREFPRGALVEERDAIRVLALAALGRIEQARHEAQMFLRAYPFSPHAERVRRAIEP